jgi:hypothetical protein
MTGRCAVGSGKPGSAVGASGVRLIWSTRKPIPDPGIARRGGGVKHLADLDNINIDYDYG